MEKAIKRMKRHKAQGVDGITSDTIKLRGQIVLTYLTNIVNNTLKAKQIPDSWRSLIKCNKERRQSSAVTFDGAEIAFILPLLHWLTLLTDEGGRKPEYPKQPLTTSFRKCHILKPQPRLEPLLQY